MSEDSFLTSTTDFGKNSYSPIDYNIYRAIKEMSIGGRDPLVKWWKSPLCTFTMNFKEMLFSSSSSSFQYPMLFSRRWPFTSSHDTSSHDTSSHDTSSHVHFVARHFVAKILFRSARRRTISSALLSSPYYPFVVSFLINFFFKDVKLIRWVDFYFEKCT